MKHVVRLLVTLILAAGIGFLIYKVVDNNKPLNFVEFAMQQDSRIKETDNNISSLKTQFANVGENYETFSRYDEMFVSLKKDLKLYESYLNLKSLTDDEENSVKNSFAVFKVKLDDLDEAVVMFKNYLDLTQSGQSQGAVLDETVKNEINQRGKKVNEKFKLMLEECLNVNETLRTIVDEKIFDNYCFDAGFNFVECRQVMIKAYLVSQNLQVVDKYALLKDVNLKVNAFFENNQQLNSDLKNFTILFNHFSSNLWQERFEECFKFGEIVEAEGKISCSNFESMLDFLGVEAYYEKV